METKNRIVKKADELFMRYGIRSISMENIVEGLGMSKKTLYQYFSDKDQLVAEVVKLRTDALCQQCESITVESHDAIHEIFLIMEHVMEGFRDMNPMVLFDLQKYHPSGFQLFGQYKNQFLLDHIRCNIQRGIREGLFRDNIQLEIISRYRLQSMMIPFDVNVYQPAQFNLAETSQLVAENYVYGLATLKGHALIQEYQEKRKNK
ncbi:MAG: TetR/AcrR family transcriptional regulator [Bacteroidetes bacterium]|nr:TetR/AcrR family transcriptional regulator [Bacteroidota bacterium]